MVGAVIGEAFLIEWLGIRGSGILVAGLGVLAGVFALGLARFMPAVSPEARDTEAGARSTAIPFRSHLTLAAAFLSGGILLAFEVVWFRFLHLFAHGGGLGFALMLSTVLMGIGLGGAIGGIWLRHRPEGFRHAASVAFVSGAACIAVYLGFEVAIDTYGSRYVHDPRDILWLTFCLTFAPSLLSGVLFTLMGASLERNVSPDSRATGLLTMSNTIGAGLGSLAGGFVLLPSLGMERSFWLLSIAYGVVGALLVFAERPPASAKKQSRGVRISAVVAAIGFFAAVALFPWDLMVREYLDRPIKRYDAEASDVVALREGVLQTNIYVSQSIHGEPMYMRLITDGYTMSGTREGGRRYMKFFVYWPFAFHPDPKRALLISYGVGSTAKALTDTRSLERIDIVDISPEIVESSKILYPDPSEDPLGDSRVAVHVEDGRYYLKSTHETYDLITGEPPPPKMAGVVSLYTREYFQLIRDRLNPGGFSTYWLPVHNLLESDSKAIIRAYCDVFEDCALWSGNKLDWILTGSNDARYEPDEATFARQWRDPVVGADLRELGIDTPALMGATFLAGPDDLRAITAETEPLVDDFPKRISNEEVGFAADIVYRPWQNTERTRERFRASPYIARTWPERTREQALEAFEYQRLLNETFDTPHAEHSISDLHPVLSTSSYRFLAVRLLGFHGDRLRAVDRLLESGESEDRYRTALAIDALVDHDYETAARHFRRAREQRPKVDRLAFLHLYAVCMSGDRARAQELATLLKPRFRKTPEGRELRRWFSRTFDLE
jgi:predicted membrane-bound spermidine synthase